MLENIRAISFNLEMSQSVCSRWSYIDDTNLLVLLMSKLDESICRKDLKRRPKDKKQI